MDYVEPQEAQLSWPVFFSAGVKVFNLDYLVLLFLFAVLRTDPVIVFV